MGRTSTKDVQLRAMADLLQHVFRAQDLSQLVRAIIDHVRDALPARARNPSALSTITTSLGHALETIYAQAVPQADHHAAIPAPRVDFETSYDRKFLELVHEAAGHLDAEPDARIDGAVLRSCATTLLEAVRLMAERRCSLYALSLVREMERLGARPTLIYLTNGTLVWQNSALTQLLEHRRISRKKLMAVAADFAGAFCAAAWRGSPPPPQASRRSIEPPVLLQAELRRSGGDAVESAVLVFVSEARKVSELSARELQVAQSLCHLPGYRAVADSLGISLDSVRTHVRRAYRKLGVTSRIALKARLIREGLIENND